MNWLWSHNCTLWYKLYRASLILPELPYFHFFSNLKWRTILQSFPLFKSPFQFWNISACKRDCSAMNRFKATTACTWIYWELIAKNNHNKVIPVGHRLQSLRLASTDKTHSDLTMGCVYGQNKQNPKSTHIHAADLHLWWELLLV